MWDGPSMRYENCNGYDFGVRVAFLLTHPSIYFHKYSYVLAYCFIVYFAVYFQLFALVRVCSLLNMYVILPSAVSPLFCLCFCFLFCLVLRPFYPSMNTFPYA